MDDIDDIDDDFQGYLMEVHKCIIDDADNSFDLEDTPEANISFEDFLFLGGFMGMMLDEDREMERIERKLEKDRPDRPVV